MKKVFIVFLCLISFSSCEDKLVGDGSESSNGPDTSKSTNGPDTALGIECQNSLPEATSFTLKVRNGRGTVGGIWRFKEFWFGITSYDTSKIEGYIPYGVEKATLEFVKWNGSTFQQHFEKEFKISRLINNESIIFLPFDSTDFRPERGHFTDDFLSNDSSYLSNIKPDKAITSIRVIGDTILFSYSFFIGDDGFSRYFISLSISDQNNYFNYASSIGSYPAPIDTVEYKKLIVRLDKSPNLVRGTIYPYYTEKIRSYDPRRKYIEIHHAF